MSSNGIILHVTGLCAGNSHRFPVNSPHKGQWRGALMFSMICAWINSWVNNHGDGDLWRHRAHYDINVMTIWIYVTRCIPIYSYSCFFVTIFNLSIQYFIMHGLQCSYICQAKHSYDKQFVMKNCVSNSNQNTHHLHDNNIVKNNKFFRIFYKNASMCA